LENRVAIPAFRDATSIDKNQRFSLQSSRFVTLFSPKAPLLPPFLKVSGTEKNSAVHGASQSEPGGVIPRRVQETKFSINNGIWSIA